MKTLRHFVAIRAIVFTTFAIGAISSHRTLYSITSRWDARWYSRIAEHGYGTTILTSDGRHLSDYAFFPLFPFLERTLHAITSLSFSTSGLLLSILASIIAAAGIERVVQTFASHDLARATVILWALYPLSSLLWMSYSESLFSALAAWALCFTLRKQWIFAGVLAALAGATRPTGLTVVAAVSVAALVELRRRASLQPMLAILLAPLGWAGFITYVAVHTHSASLFAYFSIQRDWGNGFDGGHAFFSWLVHALIHQPLVGLPALVLLVLFGWALFATWKAPIPTPLKVYGTLFVLSAVTTAGYFSSKPRYLIPAFVLLIPLAEYISRQSRKVQITLYCAGVILAAISGAFWLLGSTAP